jgi:hypothetical protein
MHKVSRLTCDTCGTTTDAETAQLDATATRIAAAAKGWTYIPPTPGRGLGFAKDLCPPCAPAAEEAPPS